MFNLNKSNNRLVIRSSPEIHGERSSSKSRKTKHTLSREFDSLFGKINNIREWTKRMLKDSIALVSMESDMDIKSYLNDSEKKHLGKTVLEDLGMDMINAAKKLGAKGGAYERALFKVGECERRLGTYGRDFVVDVCSSFIRPLQYFMEVELNKLSEEKEMLTSRKIDYEYHVRQASNFSSDKNAHHKLKMAEMALEFQYIHAKETLQGIEVSECQVGHLSDLVNVQTVYHQKCLAELEKLKSELKSINTSASNEKTKRNPSIYSSTKTSSSKTKIRAEESSRIGRRPSCSKRLENISTVNDENNPNSAPFKEWFPVTGRAKPEISTIDTSVVGNEEALVKVPEDSINQQPGSHLGNTRDLKRLQKTRSSILPPTESQRTRLQTIPEMARLRPSSQTQTDFPPKCSIHHSEHDRNVKLRHKSSATPVSHHYSGDHSGGKTDDKDYVSDDSATSKETHVIPIPARSNYRRDVGKMFFTPCKELD